MSIQSFFDKIDSILNDPKIGEKINTGLDSLNESINKGVSSLEDSVNEVINEVSSKINSNNSNSDKSSLQVDKNNMSDDNISINMEKTDTNTLKVNELVDENSEELIGLNHSKTSDSFPIEDISEVVEKEEDLKESVEDFEEVIRPCIDTSKSSDSFKPNLNLDKEKDKNEKE